MSRVIGRFWAALRALERANASIDAVRGAQPGIPRTRLARIEARLGANISGYFDPDEHQPVDEWMVLLPWREHTIAAQSRQPAEYEDKPPELVVIAPPEIPLKLEFRRKP